MDYKKILEYATEKHKGQKRSGGEPYINHPIAVARILKEKGCSLKLQIAGLLHDVLEDTDATYEEILYLTDKDVADTVLDVTKTPGYIQSEYIRNIEEKEDSKSLKLADRVHNLRDCIYTSVKFRLKCIKETEEWYVDLAKGTIFEKDLLDALNAVKDSLK